MFGMVIERVLVSDIANVCGEIERKYVAVGITNLLCNCPAMLSQYRNNWSPLLQALITAFEQTAQLTSIEAEPLDNDADPGYQNAYSKLMYAQPKVIDTLGNLQPAVYLSEALAKLSQTRPGDIPTLISALTPDHQQTLQKYCAQSGVQIV